MKIIILHLVIFQFLIALDFNFNQNKPKIILDGQELSNGFLGGTNYAVIRWADWDNDSDSDLFLLDEDGRIRYYENIGSNSEAEFSIIETNFLGINNITWFYIADFDNDNDLDFITEYPQNPSYISYYTNNNGEFINLNLLQNENGSYVLGQQGAIPTFCDIDNDNDLDFFAVNLIGTVSFYENVGLVSNKPVYNLITSDWENISIVSQLRHGANAINFIDIDNDNDFDLVWGDYYQSSLYIIWNIGSVNIPDMDNVNFSTYFPENNPINTTGRNMPSFTDIDLDGDQDLFVTVLGGTGGTQLTNNFYFYENISLYGQSNYALITDNFLNSIDLISDASPFLIDIDSDGDLDMFIGQKFITGTTPYNGRIYFYLNIGTSQNPIFNLVDSNFLGTELGTNLYLYFGDIDQDDDNDLLIGNYAGNIYIYENIGNKFIFNLTYHSMINSCSDCWFATPSLSDIDNDGDLDIISGNIYGNLKLYKQESNFNFVLETDFFQDINVNYYSAPHFVDLDLDGDDDLIVGGQETQKIYMNNNLIFEENNNINIPYLGKNIKFCSGKLFNSNQLDIISGISTGGLYILNANNCIQGDLNEDNFIDISDLIILVNIIIGIGDANNYIFCSGDLDNNNGFNILDIINLSIEILENQ
ncbi:FG-GAP-like repeat-containing protein [Candidatus Marinimicrobia bacterium]|nr:FG-GAP-like repeat-containing protein [Candidatus Neomarinimicrobiota bacterium]